MIAHCGQTVRGAIAEAGLFDRAAWEFASKVPGVPIGCGEPIPSGEEYRCIDCRGVYHKDCLRRHCAATDEKDALIQQLSEPRRTMLSSAVDEIIEDYENRAWNLATEKDKPLLKLESRRAVRARLRSFAAQNFQCLIAEIRQLRTGPYIRESSALAMRDAPTGETNG